MLAGKMKNIAVFASGRGTNFSAIIRAAKKGRLSANVSLLVCDNPRAAVIGRARQAGIKIALIERNNFPTKEEFEGKIIRHLEENNIDLIVLAGYMRILGLKLVARFKNKILNIHPALLPSFKGTRGIKDAFDYGVKVMGVTVHFVDEEMDHGPIIMQGAIRVKEGDTLESLERRLHNLEHKIYPEAIRLYAEGRLKIEARRVKILSPGESPIRSPG